MCFSFLFFFFLVFCFVLFFDHAVAQLGGSNGLRHVPMGNTFRGNGIRVSSTISALKSNSFRR